MTTTEPKEVGFNLLSHETLTLKTENPHPNYNGIVVSGDKIMVIDEIACNVQLYRSNDAKLLATTGKLDSEPCGICLINNNKICVTLKNRIEIMSFQCTGDTGIITRDRTLDVKHEFDWCHGVVKCMDNVVVSAWKDHTIFWCIVSLNDEHLGKFHQICKGTRGYLTSKENMLYISCDAGRNSPENGVYGYDIQNPNKEPFVYKHMELNDPTGITVDMKGFIFVCNWVPGCIHQLTEKCDLVAIYKDRMPWNLWAIFCDKELLFVTCYGSKDVTRYKQDYSETVYSRRHHQSREAQDCSTKQHFHSDNTETSNQGDNHPGYNGLVVTRDVLMVTDGIACNVQLYRCHDEKLLFTTDKLESEPCGICLINDNKICVTLKNRIEIMSIQCTGDTGTIKREMILHTHSEFDLCHGVVKIMDKVVVSGRKDHTIYWYIVSLPDGKLGTLHRICKGTCSYLAAKDNTIYVSCDAGRDSSDNGVYGYDTQNPEKEPFVYKHKELNDPTGITVDMKGFIFVCNWVPGCIHHLNDTCKPVAIYKGGIPWNLWAISCDKELLFVTCYGSKDITRFKADYSGHKLCEVRLRDPVTEETSTQIGQGTKDKGRSSEQDPEISEAYEQGVPIGFVRINKILYNKEAVLGRGCHGTVVYRGKFGQRDVAVKRLQRDYLDLAGREVKSLLEADRHPNVIRYFWMEQSSDFLFIALELCEGTLQDYIEDKLPNMESIKPIELLRQVLSGLSHLHSLAIEEKNVRDDSSFVNHLFVSTNMITLLLLIYMRDCLETLDTFMAVHRDLKPQNILISKPSAQDEFKAMISDFGLSKMLPSDDMTFTSKSDVLGTVGWAAPEMSIKGHKRTLAVDIFSAGCLMYYVLTKGFHPFGNKPYEIQHHIQEGIYNLDRLSQTSDFEHRMTEVRKM